MGEPKRANSSPERLMFSRVREGGIWVCQNSIINWCVYTTSYSYHDLVDVFFKNSQVNQYVNYVLKARWENQKELIVVLKD